MSRQGKRDRWSCAIMTVMFLPFVAGLAYVVVGAAWRAGRALWTRGFPLLAEGDAGAWKAVAFFSPLVAAIAFIVWHVGRDGGPNPRPGRKVYQGEDWIWVPDDTPDPGPGLGPRPCPDRDGGSAGRDRTD
ncbi:hypothetical protein ACIPPS_13875 [Streptomyces sp. NPDC090127]|uniref:hypothetical protein n=1 Tax=Streptomyces sp. NPDC090127 TaxID=3365953 RepID=UPI0038065D16